MKLSANCTYFVFVNTKESSHLGNNTSDQHTVCPKLLESRLLLVGTGGKNDVVHNDLWPNY